MNYINYYGNHNTTSIFCYEVLAADYEPFIIKKTKLFIDTEIKLRNGTMVLFNSNNSIIICKLIKSEDGFILKNLNEKLIELTNFDNIYGTIFELYFL